MKPPTSARYAAGRWAPPETMTPRSAELVEERAVGDRGDHVRRAHRRDLRRLGPVACRVGRREAAPPLVVRVLAVLLARPLVVAGPVEGDELAAVELPALVELLVERLERLAPVLVVGGQVLRGEDGVDLLVALGDVEDVVDGVGRDAGHRCAAVVAARPHGLARGHVVAGADLAAVLVAVAHVATGGDPAGRVARSAGTGAGAAGAGAGPRSGAGPARARPGARARSGAAGAGGAAGPADGAQCGVARTGVFGRRHDDQQQLHRCQRHERCVPTSERARPNPHLLPRLTPSVPRARRY